MVAYINCLSKSNNQGRVGMLGTSIPKVETIVATFLIVRFLSFICKIGPFYYKKLEFPQARVLQYKNRQFTNKSQKAHYKKSCRYDFRLEL